MSGGLHGRHAAVTGRWEKDGPPAGCFPDFGWRCIPACAVRDGSMRSASLGDGPGRVKQKCGAGTRSGQDQERMNKMDRMGIMSAAGHNAPRNFDAPGNSIRVMDCAGRAPASRPAGISHARTSRELFGAVARTQAAWRYASRRSP